VAKKAPPEALHWLVRDFGRLSDAFSCCVA